ncbi:nucleotidyltransferase family protein [Oscillatoria sp. FACHB-1407]|uniref:nucleotidyltransferase family protein n=1 Tax=Oscillatoria sp. FACHB-1407 TaxID=2692847 RepID=UPI00168874E9|nr:nucleotidyltransferase family protein [Oscillatoria sp. FACHB-1407]MBD2461250.1 nucleotidyltransferase family protein [Oscillatoria sp. FACHB-1407]
MSRTGILILAAGASTRLGQPKQLLDYQGKPLIQHMAEVAIASGGQPVGVVLGAYAAAIAPHLINLNIHLTHNAHWQTGMASSIRCGLQQVLQLASDLEAIVLMVCDQPFVTSHLIQQLMTGYQTSNSLIIASEYEDTLGVPALFDKTLFPELMTLSGDRGARSLMRQYRSYCMSIAFAQGAIDLDTPHDLDILSHSRCSIPSNVSFA